MLWFKTHHSIRNVTRMLLLYGAAFLVFAAPMSADARPRGKQVQIKYSAGTGFFVSRAGYIITNAHVLQQCQTIQVKGSNIPPTYAKLVARDESRDLALLRIDRIPTRIAPLRRVITPPNLGDKVMVLGYPGDAARTGLYTIEYSKVIGLKGPSGEEEFLQFENASRQGNSGGPLLDFAGNVIGVVTAKADIYRQNVQAARRELVSSSDVAITTASLQRFLRQHAVMVEYRDSVMQVSKYRMEDMARQYTVSILCKQGERVVR